VFLLAAACCPAVDGRESPGDKREWSVLQSLEAESRGTPTNSLLFRTVHEFEVVGIPAGDGRGPIWIMLNPSHSPFYKQMPKGDYALSEQQFEEIVSGRHITATVHDVLRSHLQ
jgi:hypothetical protein